MLSKNACTVREFAFTKTKIHLASWQEQNLFNKYINTYIFKHPLYKLTATNAEPLIQNITKGDLRLWHPRCVLRYEFILMQIWLVSLFSDPQIIRIYLSEVSNYI